MNRGRKLGGIGGYDAVYFLGLDGLKFEFVPMPALAEHYA